MAELNANLLNQVANPVLGYENMVAAKNANAQNSFNLQNQRKESEYKEVARKADLVASTLYDAADAEDYERRVQYLEKNHGIQFDADERLYDNRKIVQAKAMSLKDHLAAGKDLRDFDALQDFRAKSLEVDRERLAIDRTKAAQPKSSNKVVTDIDGQRGILDKDTREFSPIGKSPANSRPPSATALKAGFEAEDANAQIDGALSTLMEARALLTKGGEAVADDTDVLSGFGAGIRGELGAKLPDRAVPDFVATPEQGNATSEYGRIMSLEAIKNMSATLKGASTDRELFEFQRIQADPSIPNDQKLRSLDRMIRQLDRSKKISAARMKEMSGADGAAVKQNGGETIFGEAGEIPEGAIVEDEEGNRFQKNNGTLEEIQ